MVVDIQDEKKRSKVTDCPRRGKIYFFPVITLMLSETHNLKVSAVLFYSL